MAGLVERLNKMGGGGKNPTADSPKKGMGLTIVIGSPHGDDEGMEGEAECNGACPHCCPMMADKGDPSAEPDEASMMEEMLREQPGE